MIGHVLLAPQSGAYLDAALVAKHHVEQDEIDAPGLHRRRDLGHVLRPMRDEPLPLQELDHHLAHLGIIVHDEQSRDGHWRLLAAVPARSFCLRWRALQSCCNSL